MSSEISTVSLSFLSELAMHPCSEALSTLWRVNGMNSFQLFVVELDTCLVWGLRLVPSNAQTAPKGMATDGDTLRGVISAAWMPTIGPEALSTLWRVNSPNKLFSQEILHETLAHTKEVAALISQMDRKKEREKQRESPFFFRRIHLKQEEDKRVQWITDIITPSVTRPHQRSILRSMSVAYSDSHPTL